MFINYPSQVQFLDAYGLRPAEHTQPAPQPPLDLPPSSFHHPPPAADQKSSTEMILVYPRKQTVSGRSIKETEKGFYCSFECCGKRFLRNNARRVHERTVHLEEKPYQCSTCLRKFAHKSDAKKHELTHSGAKPYICLTCKRSFSQSSNLFTHIRKQHKIVPKQQDNWIKNWLI